MAIGLCNCESTPARELKVSVKDQKMALYDQGQLVRVYGVSTSKFGLGDGRSTCCTPVGKMKIVKKIGDGVPAGMVFKNRRPTGEILRPDSPGRDPIVTRILWLAGADSKTSNAYSRYIYIHGTPEERNIGHPASYGCIRMRSMDIIDLYSRVPVGATVKVSRGGLPGEAEKTAEYVYTPPPRPEPQVSPKMPGKHATGIAKR
jgi:lipoprotein-anchoring transpeptidase ErfK/SrfK